MQIVKIGLVMAVGLGSTWAARESTDLAFGPARPLPLAQAAEQTQEPPPAATPKIPELSRQEMEDELKRAQAEISGKPAAAENEEFRPSKPLAADIAISLPSDM